MYRGPQTENMIHSFFEQQKRAASHENKHVREEEKGEVKVEASVTTISEFAELNLFIYVIIRDSKLIELREKIEHSA